MLYVFIVSTGTTMKFEMNLAVKKVSELKTEICKCVQIPVEDQVLLCSGGEELKSENIVGNYFGAGTDTNPIFLFSKSDFKLPFNDGPTSIDMGMVNSVKGCASMNPSIQAITVRAALAQDFAELALKGKKECNELVHQQHLQQQGWAAVIANLEDAKDSLLKRKHHFDELFEKYLSNRFSYQETIKMFPDDIALLAKVPLLSKILLGSECSEEDLEAEHTLLSWFCAEPQQVLESLVEKCQRSLDELNENSLIALDEDFKQVLLNAENSDIKEVRGIEERLSSLNKQIEGAEKLSKDQSDLTGIFSLDRINYARDPNVLPDVCRTYQNQLELMLENHMALGEILKKCKNAKMELSESINARIKYICHLESEMYDLQVRIIFLEKHVKSVMNQIESFHQVHLAPQRYLKMLAEVFRRKEFSTNFMKWASELSEKASKLYHKEINLRKSFSSEESKNMVDNLFPGMDDVPPPFAVECPNLFDENLPNISKEDLDWLKTLLPALSHLCEVLPPEPMPYISQAESDSAFSSNIPSSLKIVSQIFEATDLCEKSFSEKEEPLSYKVVAPSSDFNSLPSGEFSSLPNEIFSLTSSPFEDPLLHNSDTDYRVKHTKISSHFSDLSVSAKATIIEEKHTLSIDSDGEEFETVDHYGTSPVEITSHSFRESKRSRPNSSSDITGNANSKERCLKVSKARSDGDAISPMQERLKSSDSLLASVDFQGTEYYIDDSMPSSYTESNATSPLMRGNRMVKSHHVVVAELQRQLEEKNDALASTSSSLETSHSNILKVHAKISALQKFIRELQGSLQNDLSDLKEFVKDELSERMSDASHVVEKINAYVGKLHQQMLLEKEEAISEAKKDFVSIENAYIHRLEVESQKLNDAENQIAHYEEHLQEVSTSYEESKQEIEQLGCELQDKKELLQRMMLEHELEFDSFKNQMKDKLQNQEATDIELRQTLSDALSEIAKLKHDKSEMQSDYSEMLEKKETIISDMQEEKKILKEEILRLQESKGASKDLSELEMKLRLTVNEKAQCMKELEEAQLNLNKLKAEAEKHKQSALKDLEEKLTSKHKNDMESLRSRFKLAVSTTSIDRLPSPSSTEPLDDESLIGIELLRKVIAENREKSEAEKKRAIDEEHAKMLETINEVLVKQEKEKSTLIATLQSDHEEALERLKSRITAENQVSFNEAINRLSKEKDAIIEELRSQKSVLEAKQFAIKAHLDKYISSFRPGERDAMSQSDSGCSCGNTDLHRAEEGIFLLKLREEFEPLLREGSESQSLYLCSQSGLAHESVKKKHKTKEEEYQRVPIRYLQSRPYPCLDCRNKISVLTCNDGDLVLLCYEERHRNFAVFHFGPFAHFLHSDSLQPLNLKLPTEKPDETVEVSSKWALGVVTFKEFCVTRKKENRYRVTQGTKFYRVKVKPWDRETALALHQMQQSTQMTSTICAPKTLSFQSSSDDGDGRGGAGFSDMSASAL